MISSMGRQAAYDLMRRHGIRPTHSLGQNFLVEATFLNEILDAAELDSRDLVLEIGPGLGHLTRLMADEAGRVIAIEIDRHLLPPLQEVTGAVANIEILHADAREVDLKQLRGDWAGPLKVVANLPYYITTPLMTKILCEWPTAERLVLTIQNEAADRVLAKPGQGAYGPLAVLCQIFGTSVKKRVIPADAFIPRPNVESCLMVMVGGPDRPPASEWPALARFLNAAFANRRKKLSNVLIGQVSENRTREHIAAAFDDLSLSANTRAEELTPEKWYQLFKRLN